MHQLGRKLRASTATSTYFCTIQVICQQNVKQQADGEEKNMEAKACQARLLHNAHIPRATSRCVSQCPRPVLSLKAKAAPETAADDVGVLGPNTFVNRRRSNTPAHSHVRPHSGRHCKCWSKRCIGSPSHLRKDLSPGDRNDEAPSGLTRSLTSQMI